MAGAWHQISFDESDLKKDVYQYIKYVAT